MTTPTTRSLVREIMAQRLKPDALDRGSFVVVRCEDGAIPNHALSHLESHAEIRTGPEIARRKAAGEYPDQDRIWILRADGNLDWRYPSGSPILFFGNVNAAVDAAAMFPGAFVCRPGILSP